MGCSEDNNRIGIRWALLLSTLLFVALTMNTIFHAAAHASKGAGAMSTIIGYNPDLTEKDPAQRAITDNSTALGALGSDHAGLHRREDPLLRGTRLDFDRLLQEGQKRPQVPEHANPVGKQTEAGAVFEGVGEFKRKALSIMVHLGIVESGKTYAIRRPVDRTVVAAKAGESLELNTKAEVLARDVKPAKADAVTTVHQEQKDDESFVVRMPVDKTVYSSLALDMLAESNARKLLTEEAKARLLPVRGELSAKFESGKDGIAAIGYDRQGGTSYGKYQIASRVGMMKLFLDFIEDKEPEWAERLRKAGPANTRSRWGGMPSEWKKIAAENSMRFEELQDAFIMQTNYEPAVAGIESRTNLNVADLSPAIKEVLWSTAVQHGPNGASNIFTKAAKVAEGKRGQDFDKILIEEVYDVRKRNFGSSSRRVRQAVHSRLNHEKDLALEMLSIEDIS